MEGLPRGHAKLEDIKRMYQVSESKRIYSSDESLISNLRWDIIFSLKEALSFYEKNADKEISSDSFKKILRRLTIANSVEEQIIAIDNALNSVHELGPFLSYIVDEDSTWEEVKEYLDHRRGN